jgi:hypothetical protein
MVKILVCGKVENIAASTDKINRYLLGAGAIA